VQPADVFQLSSSDQLCAADVHDAQERARAAGDVEFAALTFHEPWGLWVTPSDHRVYVPDVPHLRLRLLVVGHSGASGHRGVLATHALLARHFTWPGMRDDINAFVASCLHCLPNRLGHRVPRPVAQTAHADAPGVLLAVDFLYIGAPSSSASHKYSWLLVVRDDFSGFCTLTPAESCTARVVVDSLLSWFANFGVVRHIVSDRGSSFTADVIRQLVEHLHVDWHFVTAHASRANGSIERLNRDVLAALRAMVSEWHIPLDQWPSLVPVVVAVINNAPSARLAGHCAYEAFLGRAVLRPVDAVMLQLHDVAPHIRAAPVPSAEAERTIERLREALDNVHRDIVDNGAPRVRGAAQRARGRVVDFGVGDYVLCAVPEPSRVHKLLHRWCGPFVVVAYVEGAAYLVFVIRDLLTNIEQQVHADRLMLYHDLSLNVTEELKQHTSRRAGDYVVERFSGHRCDNDGVWKLRVEWLGFPPEQATYESIEELLTTVPGSVAVYLRRLPAGEEKTELLSRFGP
jgi:transposase InsO family protein